MSLVPLCLSSDFRPSLPPAKQANRNLILKAISEAQDSINKTTGFPKRTCARPLADSLSHAFLPVDLTAARSAAEADGSRGASSPPGQRRGGDGRRPARRPSRGAVVRTRRAARQSSRYVNRRAKRHASEACASGLCDDFTEDVFVRYWQKKNFLC